MKFLTAMVLMLASFGLLYGASKQEVAEVLRLVENENFQAAKEKVEALQLRDKEKNKKIQLKSLHEKLGNVLEKGNYEEAKAIIEKINRLKPSELGKQVASELCSCFSRFNPDSEDIEELTKAMECLTPMIGNEAYVDLSQGDVMGAMAEQCPAEKAKYEKLMSN